MASARSLTEGAHPLIRQRFSDLGAILTRRKCDDQCGSTIAAADCVRLQCWRDDGGSPRGERDDKDVESDEVVGES